MEAAIIAGLSERYEGRSETSLPCFLFTLPQTLNSPQPNSCPRCQFWSSNFWWACADVNVDAFNSIGKILKIEALLLVWIGGRHRFQSMQGIMDDFSLQGIRQNVNSALSQFEPLMIVVASISTWLVLTHTTAVLTSTFSAVMEKGKNSVCFMHPLACFEVGLMDSL